MAFLRVLVALLAMIGGASASTYTVGDQLGWTVPPAGDVAYKVWAAEKSFDLGDTVVFNWNGTHDVAEVSKVDYDNCTTTNPIGTIQKTSPYSVTLNGNSSRYFICTVSTHCKQGQKVTLSIGGASSIVARAFSTIVVSVLVFAFISHVH
ncbi:hypothetical protein MLD38_005771 [Melastoma candidum]|uniref:Uncharacterized protein n=1 Tax=Melastoma candidum TaxID=119954 RepID=A0ACB9RKQ4_9MYRT|nr:hypothetical protein MLD38_005771 [Melastoma candidum]